jgi:hypothetical protein
MPSYARHCDAYRGAARQTKGFINGEDMETVNVTIEGTTPLLMNRFTDEAAAKVSGGTSAVMAGNKGTPREQAEKKLYVDERGTLNIPGPNIFRAIIDAGTFHKAGKSKITTQRSSLVPAAVSLVELACPIKGPDGTPKWEVDSRSVVIPATGGRVMCHRPRVDAWRISFTLEIDTDLFTVQLVRQLLDDAGKRIGLGDFRPSRKGPFGRFVVVAWDVAKATAKAA